MLQQLWLQNYPRIFQFYVENFIEAKLEQSLPDEIVKVLLSELWEMPKSPKSETQILSMDPIYMQYLEKGQ